MDKATSKLIIGAITAASVVASLAGFFTSTAPEAKAAPAVTSALNRLSSKGDRLPLLASGAACSSRAWPNYDRACQFDLKRGANDDRTVRVIALR
jgi:hypothetical protein